MKQNFERPSAFSTGFEVLRFAVNPQHSIANFHHTNLVDFRGCSKERFKSYVKFGHSIDDDAILYAIKNGRAEALDIILRYRPYSFNDTLKEAFVNKFGFKEFFKKGNISLPAGLTNILLEKGKTDIALKYFNLLEFDTESMSTLLKLHDVPLTVKLLENKKLGDSFASEVLTYNEPEVYEAFFKNAYSSEVAESVLREKSAQLFEVMVKNSCKFPRNIAENLVDENNVEKFKTYVKYHSINEDFAKYIAQNASDEIFAYCIENDRFSEVGEDVYERLFKPENRNLLAKYLKTTAFNSSKWEIKLFDTDDTELIRNYFSKHPIEPETKAYILTKGMGNLFNITCKNIETGNWRAETLIFTSGDSNLIEEYLFASKAFDDGLTAFGEAQLFLYAPIRILSDYLAKNTPYLLAQRAIIRRNDAELYEAFLDDNRFDDEVVYLFFERAETSIVKSYLENADDIEYLFEESHGALRALLKRNEAELLSFVLGYLDEDDEEYFVAHAPIELVYKLIEEDPLYESGEAELFSRQDSELIKCYFEKHGVQNANEALFVRYAPVELIYKFIKEENLTNEAEEEILNHKDKKLTQYYLKNYNFSSNGTEEKLLNLLDMELIDAYGEDEFDSSYVLVCLGS